MREVDIQTEIPEVSLALTDNDNRAQKIPTQRISLKKYRELVEPINFRAEQYLMLHDPRDKRGSVIKIAHDMGIKFSRPTATKIYYDIETFDFVSKDVPHHTSRNAYISMIGMYIVRPDGSTQKLCLLNQMLQYTYELTPIDITVKTYTSESLMC